MPADETQLLYSLCLHGRGELGLAPDEYAGLTMVLLRLLAFKPAAGRASAQGSAAEPLKKSLPEAAKADAPLHVLPASALAVRSPVLAVPAQSSPSPTPPVTPSTPSTPSTAAENIEITHPALVDIAPPAINSEADSDLAVTLPAQQTPQALATPDTPAMPATPATPEVPDVPAASRDGLQLDNLWSVTVNQLVAAEAVAALTRELALQSQLCGRSGVVWQLRVERESLSQSAAREKLQLAMQVALADPALKISVEIGPVTDSPARRNAAALAERQKQAEATIQGDPFVQDMIRDWGAKIVPGSIKPLPTLTPRPI